MRKFIRQWRKRYPFPFPWVDDRANKQYRRSEAQWLASFDGATTLRRRDVVHLIEWRFGSQTDEKEHALDGVTGPSESGHTRRCIKRALEAPNPTEALDQLLGERGGIRGWGPAMASVVLAVCRPDTYVIADHRALRSLGALGLYSAHSEGDFVPEDWWPYLRICRRLAKDCGVSLPEVVHALTAAAEEAPKLPKSAKPPRQKGSAA